MNRNMVVGLIGGAVAATALGGVAGYRALSEPAYAEVIAVDAVTETVKIPREECREIAVQARAPVQDEHRVAGTALGAIAGGLLGNQVGGGSGKTLATVAGAAAGGYAGNRAQKSMQESDTVTRMETRCQTVNDTETRTLGYDVRYRLDDKEGVVRVAQPPAGNRIPVEDGQLKIETLPAS